MKITSFLLRVEEIRAEKPTYRLGGDGSDGTCDCIGLIIGAIRREGGAWTGTHGTNYTARNELNYLLPVTAADELMVGEVVFKARTPGSSGYDLPSSYDNSPDKRDYYHIGVVMSVSPLRILHCTHSSNANGVTEDDRLGNWTYRGWLKKVDKEGDVPMDVKTAIVTAESGKTVNLRKSPGGALITRVPLGQEVMVTARHNGWSRVAYKTHVGWMMDAYLLFPDGVTAPDGDLEERVAALEERVTALEKAVSL